MQEPLWIAKRDAVALHGWQLAEHGGPSGMRDEGLLESALARPKNLFAYGDPDFAELAADYAYGLAKNHPFIDGNKHTSFGVCATFLDLNGFDLPVDDDANISTWLALAEGSLTEAELAGWLRAWSPGRLRPASAE